MRNLTFKKRLGLGFGVVVAVAAVIAVVGYRSTYTMSDQNDHVVTNAQIQNLNMEMEWSIAVQSESVRGFLLTGDTQQLSTEGDARKHFVECEEALAGLISTDRQKELFASTVRQHDRINSDYDRILSLFKAGNRDEAVRFAFSDEVKSRQAQAMAAMKELDDLGDGLVAEAVRGHNHAEVAVRTIILLVGLIGLAAGILSAVLVVRSITRPIHRLVETIKAIECNDLTVNDLEVISQDELGEAARALNSMKKSLHNTVQSLANSANELAAASQQISGSSNRVAEGAGAQKGKVQQVASTMEEMSATVREISSNSNGAAVSARQASDVAREGGTIVEDALGRMQSIAEKVQDASLQVSELGSRSDQIGKIVGVIDEIAEQTNLLALNAAIEAARAGEHGRGFAVVAGEVRRLAERTSQATKEITGMIGSVQTETHSVVEFMRRSTDEVQRGLEVTGNAGESLKQIIAQAEQVGQMVAQIAAAATEQSVATEEVASTMMSFNQLVATSADEAQSAASASDQLAALAGELRNVVGRFRVFSSESGEASSHGESRNAAAVAARRFDPVVA
jgi:methyl-accepting chemotaxis protein